MPFVETVLATAGTDPDRPAMVCGDRELSYGELAAKAAALDLGLSGRGPDQQLLVALNMTDPLELAVVLLASISAGRCVAVLDPHWSVLRRNQIVARLGADTLMVESLSDIPSTEVSAKLSDGPDELAFYIGFTSGSSSHPKIYVRDRGSWDRSLERSTDLFDLRPAKKMLACGSLSSSLSLYALAECFYSGATFHWLESDDAMSAASLISSRGIEHLVATPVLLDLMAARKDKPWDAVETVVCGGAGLAPRQRQNILEAAPASTLYEYYGASELSLVTVRKHAPDEDVSAGTPVAGVELEIRESAVGQDTLWVRTDMACRGYLDGEDLMVEDGWVSVGDQGRLDEHGRLHLLGRHSSMLLVSGLNVYPEQVESALAAAGVSQSCVVGRPHDRSGTQLVAVIPADAVRTVNRREMRRRLRELLPGGAVPDLFLVIDELPLLENGKLDRESLRTTVIGPDSGHVFLQ